MEPWLGADEDRRREASATATYVGRYTAHKRAQQQIVQQLRFGWVATTGTALLAHVLTLRRTLSHPRHCTAQGWVAYNLGITTHIHSMYSMYSTPLATELMIHGYSSAALHSLHAYSTAAYVHTHTFWYSLFGACGVLHYFGASTDEVQS